MVQRALSYISAFFCGEPDLLESRNHEYRQGNTRKVDRTNQALTDFRDDVIQAYFSWLCNSVAYRVQNPQNSLPLLRSYLTQDNIRTAVGSHCTAIQPIRYLFRLSRKWSNQLGAHLCLWNAEQGLETRQ